jgi:uncharacterized membrane protein
MGFLSLIFLCGIIYAVVKLSEAQRDIRSLREHLIDLENRLGRLHVKIVNQFPGFEDKTVTAAPAPAPEPSKPAPAPTPVPPPVQKPTAQTPKPVPAPVPAASPARAVLPAQPARMSSPVDWENFMGVKLFAWLGGFALFLGMAFFVKYSIDHNLISPLMRVMIGFVIGIGVIVWGLMVRSKGYDVTVQTLCAAGISILYADLFACRSFYNFLTPEAAFPLMILVTVACFFLAVRLDSRYVAILGLIGGFLTPVLLSTGVDRPIALFSYIALLDAGLAAVALKKRWGFLIGMSCAATLLMEAGWTARFLTPDKAELAFGIYLFFSLFYVFAAEAGKAKKISSSDLDLPASMIPLISMGFVGYMLTFQSLAVRPGLVLTLLLLLSLQLAYIAVRFDHLRPFYVLGGLMSFILLMIWTMAHLKSDLLLWGLGYYMAFAIIHAALPILLQRIKPSASPFLWGYAFPLLMLVLITFAMAFCDILSFFMWPVVFVIGLLAIGVAWLAGSLLAAAGTIALVMLSFGIWLFRLPDVGGLGGILLLLGFFTCAFFAWGLLVTRKSSLFAGNAPQSMARGISSEEASQLPAFSALMPFMLLAMVCLKLRIPDPSQIFGLMTLIGALLLGLVRYRALDAASLVALFSTAAVEFIWHQQNFSPREPLPALGYMFFYGMYFLFPFLFHRRLKGTTPWIASALAGPVHFWLIYDPATEIIGKTLIGLVPALFAVISLKGLYQAAEIIPKTDPRRNSLLAWYGGVTLFFVTLILPVQFDKEWLTLGWALEGAALLWLLHRVPHEGLKTWGIALLMIAFVRLAINPAVFSYHPRTGMPLFNWYLWVYGASALCYLAAARWLRPPRNLFMGVNMPPFLNSLGVLLMFLLLNIQIADYFSTGSTITFNFFSSSFAQDMTYSLAWGVFAIVLLVVGIGKGLSGARYASLALLSVTILKVFLHDLWRLGQLFRVASFVGLAVVLILVSFLYQKYVAANKEGSPHA